jgi:hypothetical protein
MSTENEPQTGAPRTAEALIQEAARVVNWRPDQKHPLQARYDAARAMASMYAYWTIVSLETLRRVNPALAEAVTTHIDDDLDWPNAHEHAYGWEQTLAAGKTIPADAWPFGEITDQSAGQHHTDSSPISDAMVEQAAKAACEFVYPPKTHRAWDDVDDYEQDSWRATARTLLEAAYPAIRQQVAEQITTRLTARRSEITPGRPGWVYLTEAIDITREIGGVE